MEPMNPYERRIIHTTVQSIEGATSWSVGSEPNRHVDVYKRQGLILGGLNFSALSLQIKDASIAYGAFIQNVIDFLIVALCLFLMIKFVSKLTAKKRAAEEAEKAAKKAAEEEAAAAKAAEKSAEVLLLEEIRDLMKKEA